ncbi:hypothetical protein C0993_008184, partial [Termitomyces sp. T159_Od127]
NRERERLRCQQRREARAEAQATKSKNSPVSASKTTGMPPDFSFVGEICAEQAWNDALTKLEGDPVYNAPDAGITSVLELDELFKMRRDIMNWSFGWGGIAHWSMAIDYSFGRAVDQNRVEEWREQVFWHAEMGRALLHRLTIMD